MTNSITGDYDVVIQLSFDTLNRILAALHETKNEPHSLVWEIVPERQPITVGGGPVSVGSAMNRVAPPKPTLGTIRQPEPVIGVGGTPTVSPRGLAEVQVSTPTVTIPVPQDTWTKITVHQWIMIYFIPDANNPVPMPEFIHGELKITPNVALKLLAGGTTLNVDLTSKQVQVSFTPIWTSSQLNSNQSDWLIQYIREFLATKTSPINVTLPQSFQQLNRVDVKFLQTPTSGLGALLVSVNPANPNPSSVSSDLIGDGNDFAIAVSGNYAISLIQNQLTVSDFTISFTIDYLVGSTTIHYNIHVNSITVTLSAGTITLTINGHAHTGSHFPSPDFTITQKVALTVSNSTVSLTALGDPSVSLSGALGVVEGAFDGGLVGAIRPRRDQLLQQAQAHFQSMLNSQTQSIIQSIINTLNVDPQIEYHDVAIVTDGIVLHGNVRFQDQVPVHVEFTERNIRVPESPVVAAPPMASARISVPGGGAIPTRMVDEIELNALSSWIPGGTIGSFTWTLKSWPLDAHPHIITEQHRFVTRVSKDIPTGYVCLKVDGTRVTGQAVNGELCVDNILRIPIVNPPPTLNQLLTVAIVPNKRGQPSKPVAHVNPWASNPSPEAIANETIIHFVDPHSIEKDLTTLRETLAAETQSSAFVVVVLPHEHIGKIGSIELPKNYFLAWANEHDGSWQRTFKVTKAPATVILNRAGAVVWHEHGPIPPPKLKTALKQNLLPRTHLSTKQHRTALQVGKRPPDFQFEYSENTEMTLRNFNGRPVTLIFWASWSEPSLEELEYLEQNQNQFSKDQVILLVNSVDTHEKAKETLKKHHITFPPILDEQNQIAKRYGINCWPTIISIDAKGIIRNIYLGTTEKPDQSAKPKTPTK